MDSIFELKYHLHTKEETLDELNSILENEIYSGAYRADINVATIVSSTKDKLIKEYINNSYLCNIDGMGAILGVKFLGKKVPERITGVDLFLDLLHLANAKHYSIYLLGAKQSVLDIVQDKINNNFPNVSILGAQNGYYENEDEVIFHINSTKPDILFIANKSPNKEYFVLKYKDEIKVKLLMGVGGTFDVYSGEVKRAPDFIQKIGFEWLYRLLQEPRRMWKRYLISNSIYLYLLLKEKVSNG